MPSAGQKASSSHRRAEKYPNSLLRSRVLDSRPSSSSLPTKCEQESWQPLTSRIFVEATRLLDPEPRPAPLQRRTRVSSAPASPAFQEGSLSRTRYLPCHPRAATSRAINIQMSPSSRPYVYKGLRISRIACARLERSGRAVRIISSILGSAPLNVINRLRSRGR
jgi:hypothetical protein